MCDAARRTGDCGARRCLDRFEHLVTNTDTSKSPGDTGTANVWLEVSKDEPEGDRNGCNVDKDQPGTVTLSSNNPAVTFPNGNTAQLIDCLAVDKNGNQLNTKQITYKVADNAQAGQAVITGTVTGGKANSLYTQDTLTVTILAPAKQNTSMSEVSGSGTYSGNATLTATLKTAAGTALSDKSVDFTLNGNSVGSSTTGPNGVATKSVSLSGIDAGSYTNSVSANFAGDTSNNGSTASGNLTVSKADATIKVDGYTGTYDGDAHGASGTATGVGGVDLSGQLDLGSTFTDVPGGTANWTFAGNANHKAASGSVEIKIAKAPSTTTVTCTGAPFTYTGQPITPCSATVTGAGGLSLTPAVDYSNNVNAGTATASYTYAGGPNHNGSSDSTTFTIDKATAQVELSNLNHIYDGTAKAAQVSTTPAGLNVSVTYNGSSTAPTNVGSYNVVATVNEANYQGSANGTLTIGAWTFSGFYQPVDMGIWNTVKAGSTVPMKFELFKGDTELKDVSDIKSYAHKSVGCGALDSTAADAIEITTSGSTSLRFDSTSDQFIFNWKTQSTWKAGTCYVVTVVGQDGTPLNAYFKMK